jgi:putative ABC transport system permease protein
MSWIEGARARLRLLFARRAAESRMNEEVAFHIDMESDRLVREEGLEPHEARRRALVAFGGVTQHKEELRDGRGMAWMGGVKLDCKLAIRMLVKYPGLTLVAVVGMAVAVTIAAVSFSVISTLVDGKPPLPGGASIISIRNIDRRGGFDARATHLHDLSVWREALGKIVELGAYRAVDRNLITNDGRSESVHIAEMTASGFRIARVPPLLGRALSDEDESPSAPAVVVIGYDLWQARFAARPDVVGQTLRLGDVRHTIVGVMPERFAFPVNNRIWTPLRLNPSDYEPGRAPSLEVFGRLVPGASTDDVRRQFETIAQRLAAADPALHGFVRTRVLPYTRTFIDNPEATWLYTIAQLLFTLLLVVIGANVAVLVYARTASRMGEIAIRTALGASRARVVAQLFAEALALSTIASVIGVFGAHTALARLNSAIETLAGAQLPFWLRFHINSGVLLYAVGLAIIGAVVVGVVPALKATRSQVRSSLQQLSSGGSAMRLGKGWTFLIIAQVAFAVAVLPVSVAGIAAWKRVDATRSRLAMKHMLTATVFYDARDATPRYAALRAELVDRLRAEPGVSNVVFASTPPGDEVTERVETDAADTLRADTAAVVGSPGNVVGETRVDLDYFAAFDIPILGGRGFQPGDFSTPTRSVIVNRSFVRTVLGGANPLGHRIRDVRVRSSARGGEVTVAPWEEIVGVIPDFPIDSATPQPKVYRPLLPTGTEPVTMAVRIETSAPVAFTNRLRQLTLATSPMLRLDDVKSLDQMVYDQKAAERVVIIALELVTGSTLLLSAAGIYALMGFTITRRRREIGIRAALGAGPHRVLMSVLSRVVVQLAIGIAIGISVATLLDRALAGGWTGRRSAIVLPGVVAFMSIVALIAAIGPASWALRIPPTEALRSE